MHIKIGIICQKHRHHYLLFVNETFLVTFYIFRSRTLFPLPPPLLTGVQGYPPEKNDFTDARRRVLMHFGYKSTLIHLVFCPLTL